MCRKWLGFSPEIETSSTVLFSHTSGCRRLSGIVLCAFVSVLACELVSGLCLNCLHGAFRAFRFRGRQWIGFSPEIETKPSLDGFRCVAESPVDWLLA